MGLRDFIITVLGLISTSALGWALTIVCSHPEAAQWLYWISALALGMLGPIWAFQASGYTTMTRGISTVATVVLASAGLFWALSLKSACAQDEKSTGANCSINIGRDNNAPATNNCQTNYYGAKRQPSCLYQSDERIGVVEAATLDKNNNEITLINPHISGIAIDFSLPIEFQKFNILCDNLVEISKRPHGTQMSIAIAGDLKCKISGVRNE